MADNESTTLFPPYDGSMPIEVYRWALKRHNHIMKARQSPMLNRTDADGNPLYKLTSSGNLKRTTRPSKSRRRQVLERDGHACTQCGSTDELEVDHIVRYIDGGSHDLSNLRTLCNPCHRRRGGRA